jgi:raffinose/stachyose/melibiose transport system permease protein
VKATIVRKKIFKNLKTNISYFHSYLILLIASLTALTPIVWIWLASFKSGLELTTNPLGIPRVWHFEQLVQAWNQAHFSRLTINSVIVALPTVLLILLLSGLAAYAFAKFKFKGKNAIYFYFLAGMTIPLEVIIVPLFYELLYLKLLNTYWAMILPQVALTLPFGVFLLRGFMEEIPQSIIDAAKIDGCSEFRIFFNIVLPIARPILATLGAFSFLWCWNTFLLPFIVFRDESLRTVQTGLAIFQGKYQTNVALVAAAATIVSIPIIIVYILFQKQFIKGITAGAIKE